MDGLVNNLELRAEAADMIILIILPRWLCLWRMLKRYWAHRGKFREDGAPGCPEKFRWHFIKYGWTFPKRIPRMLEIIHKYQEGRQIYILRSRAEVKGFFKQFAKKNGTS